VQKRLISSGEGGKGVSVGIESVSLGDTLLSINSGAVGLGLKVWVQGLGIVHRAAAALCMLPPPPQKKPNTHSHPAANTPFLCLFRSDSVRSRSISSKHLPDLFFDIFLYCAVTVSVVGGSPQQAPSGFYLFLFLLRSDSVSSGSISSKNLWGRPGSRRHNDRSRFVYHSHCRLLPWTISPRAPLATGTSALLCAPDQGCGLG
jgi:hypothetical protein